MRCSVVVITMGDRPRALQQLISSLGDSSEYERLLFGNGCDVDAPHGWRVAQSSDNLGVSGGRRAAAAEATGDVLIFLDDDCVVQSPTVVDQVAAHFARDDRLGAVAFRIVVAGSDETPSHWNPRLGTRRVKTPGDVTSFIGGGHAIRTTAYEQVGGYHPDFFYSHEEIDLAWRLLDGDWTIFFDPSLVIEHPATDPDRNTQHVWFAARNRMWLARSRLPLPLAPAYAAMWLVVQLARVRRSAELQAVVYGSIAGLRESPGARSPVRWSTIGRMTRLGRPPLI